MKISIVLADDHVLMRQGIISMLQTDASLDVIGECADGVALLELVIRLSPDVILMDISMPRMSGLVAIDKILARRSDAKILVLSMHNEIEYIEAMQGAGAMGYILKESSQEALIDAIHKVAAGRPCFEHSGLTTGKPPPSYASPLTTLTRREREVFFLVAAGHTSKHIAHLLDMSLKTAENHRSNIYRKLNIKSSAELVRLAGKAGLLE